MDISGEHTGLQNVRVCISSLKADPRLGIQQSDDGRNNVELLVGQVRETDKSPQQQRSADVSISTIVYCLLHYLLFELSNLGKNVYASFSVTVHCLVSTIYEG